VPSFTIFRTLAPYWIHIDIDTGGCGCVDQRSQGLSFHVVSCCLDRFRRLQITDPTYNLIILIIMVTHEACMVGIRNLAGERRHPLDCVSRSCVESM